MRSRLPSIQRHILFSIILVLLILTATLSVAFGLVLYRNIQSELQERLDKALRVAWQEYESGQQQTLSNMTYLARMNQFTEILEAGDATRLRPLLHQLPNVDFAAFIGPDGTVLAHTNSGQEGSTGPLSPMAVDVVRQGNPQISTEKLSAAVIEGQAPSQASRTYVSIQGGDGEVVSNGLVQVVIYPVVINGHREGALMAGTLLNNTTHIQQAVSTWMPNSYMSISCEGVRVSSNILTEIGPLKVGGRQTQELIRAVGRGERYFGFVPLETERHYVASDPIRNGAGYVIGALSIGMPPSGFAGLQRDAVLAILGSAALSLILAVGIAQIGARKLSEPIVWLAAMTQKLANATDAHGYDLTLAECEEKSPPLYSLESTELHQAFIMMARDLRRRCQETTDYLERLERDRETLQTLTRQLTEGKGQLEQKVEERTRELTQAVEELQQVNTMKTQFLATMSHELRTPLNSVIGFSEMLVDELAGPVNQRQREYLNNVLAAAQHLLELINDMLNLSRIERGKLVLDWQEVLVGDVVTAVQTMVCNQAVAAGLALTTEVAPAIPPLWADPTRMKEVLYNLLSNAIKFTPVGGKIWVRAWAEEQEVFLQVEDTGIGMKLEDQQAVFNEFVQAEGAYQRRFEGAGLGLPLAKKLVELHGGQISLTSQLGQGTTVTVRLPVGHLQEEVGNHAS